MINIIKNKVLGIPNLYKLVIIGGVLLFGLFLYQPNSAMSIWTLTKHTITTDLKAELKANDIAIKDYESNEKIFLAGMEELQSKVHKRETKIKNLEVESQRHRKRAMELTIELAYLDNREPLKVPEGKNEIAKMLTDMRYPASVCNCQ